MHLRTMLRSPMQRAARTSTACCDGQRTALQHRTQNSGLGRGVPIVAPNIRFAICQNRPSFAHAMPPSPPADATRDIGHDLSGCAATLCLFRFKPHLQHTLLSGHPRPSDFMAEDAKPESPFSISSIQRTEGETASAIFKAFLILLSDSPTIPPKILPISNFIIGNCQAEPTAFAHKLLPVPGIPSKSIPLGVSSPYSLAFSSNARPLLLSQSFKISNPPTSSKVSL